MFGRISFIGEDNVLVDLNEGVELKKNILSSHVVITDKEKMLLGEISELNQGKVKIKLLGEFQNDKARCYVEVQAGKRSWNETFSRCIGIIARTN